MKHIKKYKNHIEYLAQIDEEYFPNVSYCNAENELHYNLQGEHYGDVTKILCQYDVVDSSTGTKIYNTIGPIIDFIQVNGVRQSEFSNSYVFPTEGINLVKFFLKEGVTAIPEEAFKTCKTLVSVDMENSHHIVKIGHRAFQQLSNLKYVHIPQGITMLDINTFQSDIALQTIDLPEGLTSIGDGCFQYCSSLQEIVFPSTTTSIGGYSLRYCSQLKSITCLATNPPALGNDTVFDDNHQDRLIYVPAESVEAYKTAWSKWANSITSI